MRIAKLLVNSSNKAGGPVAGAAHNDTYDLLSECTLSSFLI